jgi:hypothetical protein
VRRQHPLHAAGKDKWNALAYTLSREAHPITDQLGQAEHQVATRIIVDESISMRLADDGDDLPRINDAFIDRLAEA